MTFDELKKRSAGDLREIAKFLEKRATQIEAGDLQVMDHFLDDEWQRWYEMLLIRYAWGQEQRRDAGYAEPNSSDGGFASEPTEMSSFGNSGGSEHGKG